MIHETKVIFVVGGPGSGKGTQCRKIVENFKFVHLSVGDILRAEMNSDSENGILIKNMVKEGQLVPSEIVVRLLMGAMIESDVQNFLIDGFPRIEDNRKTFKELTGITPDLVLFFDCPQQLLVQRLLKRGRGDDDIETITKRLQVFLDETLPVVDYYEENGILRRINAAKSVETVFHSFKSLFIPYLEQELLQISQELVDAIDGGDYDTYVRLCDSSLTAFEPESQGHLVEGLPFHKFYFGIRGAEDAEERISTISSPKVRIISEDNVLVTYTRLLQQKATHYEGFVHAYMETRLWKRNRLSNGEWEWKHIHFHRSKAPTL